MSLLTICQQALTEIGLPKPSTVATDTTAQGLQTFALANRAGFELRDGPGAADYWPVLRQQFLFNMVGYGAFSATFTPGSTTVTGITGTGLASVGANFIASSKYLLNDTLVVSVNAGAGTCVLNQAPNLTAAQGAQTDTNVFFGQEAYPVPSDLNYFIPQTGWDRNFRWQLLGPLNAQEWQVVKSGISPVGPRLRYRLMANQIYLNPAPYVIAGTNAASTDLIVMEYASVNWCAAAGGTTPTKAAFTADTDVCLAFPEDLVTKSLKWRMLKQLGSSYEDAFDEYEDMRDRFAGRFMMPRNLPLNARAGGVRLLNSQNVPDTGFGS